MRSTSSAYRRLGWVVFWTLAGLFYITYFGRTGSSYRDVLHLALPLLAIAMGTSFVIGSILIPRYLLRGRYYLFGLYSVYTLVVAAFTVLGVIVGSFVLFADFQTRNMAPAALDRAGLFVGVGMVVAFSMVIHLVQHWNALREAQHRLQLEKQAAERSLDETRAELGRARKQLVQPELEHLEIQVDRKTVRLQADAVRYLESAGDYVLVTTDSERLITKARLSDLAHRLEDSGFARVHRSFVVRIEAVEAWNGSEITIGQAIIPVGRTYRPSVRARLRGSEAAGSKGSDTAE